MPDNTVVVQAGPTYNVVVADTGATIAVPGSVVTNIAQPIDNVTNVSIPTMGPQGAQGSQGVAGISSFQTVHNYAIGGAIVVTTSVPLPPMFFYEKTGQTASIKKVAFQLGAGSCTMALRKNGTQIEPSTINVTTTRGTMTFNVALADGDTLLPEVVTVASSPTNLTFTIIIEHNVS